jgi:sugar phosphate isomerase/epimerase
LRQIPPRPGYNKGELTMKLGIGTYTYMWSIGFERVAPNEPLDVLGLLEKARELGVGVVQIGPNLPLDVLGEAQLEAVIERAREWNIEIELGTRGLETEHLRRQISLADRLGAKLLRTVPEIGGAAPSVAEMTACLREIEPELADAGVRLAMENAVIPAADLAGVLRNLGSPWLGITLDTVNSLAIPEGTEYVARQLAPYTMCLHVKDFVVQRVWHMMGFTVEGRPAGNGQLNVPWLLDLLREVNVSANAILELWVPQQATLEETIKMEHAWAEESVAYLRRYIRC